MILQVIKERKVECGTCRDCCKNDAIFIHPECGDEPSQFLTETYMGRTILQHKPNGDCVYLDEIIGCTVHDRRPAICRELDCRELVEKIGEKRCRDLGLAKLVYAAKRLRKFGKGTAST